LSIVQIPSPVSDATVTSGRRWERSAKSEEGGDLLLRQRAFVDAEVIE
jgi:hypothetical protein